MIAEICGMAGISQDRGNYGIDTSFSGTLKFSSGAIGNITSAMNQSFRCEISIDGSKGRIEIPEMFNDSGSIIIRKENKLLGKDEKITSTPSPYRFVVQFDEFSECILTGKNPEFPPEDGMRNTGVIESLYKSANLGKIIEI